MNEKKGFLLLLIAFTALAISAMLSPFFAYIVGAMILAFVMREPHRLLRERIGKRPSAMILTLLSILLVVLPMILGGAMVADNARNVVSGLSNGTAFDFTQVEAFVSELTGQEFDLEASAASLIRQFSSTTLGSFTNIVSAIAGIALGVSLMIFLEYYFMKDGRDFIQWLIDFSPLPEDIERSLLKEVSRTTSAVLKGHLMVAIAQGLIAGFGFILFGVPNVAFWTFIMIILGVIPIIGSSIVWIPASFYLAISGEPVSGILLAVYGIVVVGLSDNFLRPYFVDSAADLNPSLIILGVIGGVTAFGPVGLFIGPVIFGIFKSVSKVFMKNYDDL
jgi:predicted PurR-regulated permease PerM